LTFTDDKGFHILLQHSVMRPPCHSYWVTECQTETFLLEWPGPRDKAFNRNCPGWNGKWYA